MEKASLYTICIPLRADHVYAIDPFSAADPFKAEAEVTLRFDPRDDREGTTFVQASAAQPFRIAVVPSPVKLDVAECAIYETPDFVPRDED